MYQSINESEFRSAFHSCGRGKQFSYEGMNILFNGLEQYESDANQKMEFDVIAICCDFSEMALDEIKASYDIEEGEDAEEFLSDNTWVLGSHEKDGIKYFLFQQF
jgi:hypothetical protein